MSKIYKVLSTNSQELSFATWIDPDGGRGCFRHRQKRRWTKDGIVTDFKDETVAFTSSRFISDKEIERWHALSGEDKERFCDTGFEEAMSSDWAWLPSEEDPNILIHKFWNMIKFKNIAAEVSIFRTSGDLVLLDVSVDGTHPEPSSSRFIYYISTDGRVAQYRHCDLSNTSRALVKIRSER